LPRMFEAEGGNVITEDDLPKEEAEAPPTRDEVISVNRTVRHLPWRDAHVRRWLRDSGLIYTVDGREVVVWGDVLDAIRRQRDPKPSKARVKSAKKSSDAGVEAFLGRGK
jgi:hypothetical protein